MVAAVGTVIEVGAIIEVSGVGRSPLRVRLVIGVDVASGEGFPIGRVLGWLRAAALVDGWSVDSRADTFGTGPARSGRR
jgi:hypothetical protein